MKKYILSLVLILILAGCGSNMSTNTQKADVSKTATTETSSTVETSATTISPTSTSSTTTSTSQSRKIPTEEDKIKTSNPEMFLQDEWNRNGVAGSNNYDCWATLIVDSTDPYCKLKAELAAKKIVTSAEMLVGVEGPFEIRVFASDNPSTPACIIQGMLHYFEKSETQSISFPLFGE